MAHSFILKKQPKSHNKWKPNTKYGQGYKDYIIEMFDLIHGRAIKKEGDLYGIAYYFYKKNVGLDADNISKPIWDCLTNYLYSDDKQVKIRLAGCFDLSKNDFDVLNVTGVSGIVVAELVEAIEKEDHIVYVECGHLSNNHFKFNIEE